LIIIGCGSCSLQTDNGRIEIDQPMLNSKTRFGGERHVEEIELHLVVGAGAARSLLLC
jgi:hypothetical protein